MSSDTFFNWLAVSLRRLVLLPLLLIIFLSGISRAQIITVDHDGEANFTSIQAAIDSATNGDTVFVKAGIYSELVTVDKNILLLGEGRDSTAITAPESDVGKVVVNFYKAGTIKGFTISGGKYNSGVSGTPRIIEHNIITTNAIGILIGWGTIRDNIITNNNDGILFHIDPKKNNNLVIDSNEIYGNTKGIYYSIGFPDYPDSSFIIGNTIYNNSYGIYYEHEIPLPKVSGIVDSVENHSINAKRNWWGTANGDSIAVSIFDKSDWKDNTAVVDFSEWLQQHFSGPGDTTTTGIHYNNILNNSLFNLYASIPVSTSVLDNETNENSEALILHQNYPNPFNPVTNIRFTIPDDENVKVSIYNLMGQEIVIVVDNYFPSGTHEITWNASHYSSGVYFCTMRTQNTIQTKSLLLLK